MQDGNERRPNNAREPRRHDPEEHVLGDGTDGSEDEAKTFKLRTKHVLAATVDVFKSVTGELVLQKSSFFLGKLVAAVPHRFSQK